MVMETNTPSEAPETPAVRTFYILRLEPFQMYGTPPADPAATLPTVPVCVGMLDLEEDADRWSEHRSALLQFFAQNPDAPGGNFLTVKCPDNEDDSVWGWEVRGQTATHTVEIV